MERSGYPNRYNFVFFSGGEGGGEGGTESRIKRVQTKKEWKEQD